MENEKVYYIVNPAGCIHNVTKEHARMRLKQLGYRLATADEIKKYQELQQEALRLKKSFIQSADKPICKPYSAEPPDEQELPEPVEVPKTAELAQKEKPAKEPVEKAE